MKSKEFFRKLLDKYVWGNLIAMAIVLAVLLVGLKYGLEAYTRHGEEIPVPDVKGMTFAKAKALIEYDGLRIEVSDTAYNKQMPADCVLLQNPAGGAKVKTGHIIHVTVNSESTPTRTIPDLVDNSSVRDAEARLRAMGFILLEPEDVTGEKDWVYGIEARGRSVAAGDRVPIDVPLKLLVGNGMYADSTMVEDDFVNTGFLSDYTDIDEFEVVEGPPAEESDEIYDGQMTAADSIE